MTTQKKADLNHQVAEEEYEEDARKSGEALGPRRRFTEFECAVCTAYNPHDGFGNSDEIRCSYCGVGFIAVVDDAGRLKLREE